jgi:putative peptide zinc metalloprotease protein
MMQTRQSVNGGKMAAPATVQLPQRHSSAALELPACPALAANVQLVGEMQGTGFTDRQWLIQRDGRFIQVSELLYRVAERINGKRALEEIAAGVTAATDWSVNADHVRHIIQTKLIPLGLIATADGAVASHIQDLGRSPLQVQMRRTLLSPQLLDPIARALQALYTPSILVPTLLAIALAHGWLYLIHGVSESVRAALYTPGGLLVVLAIALVSGLFHEFGHAAALRYGGGKVRGTGVGFYLIYPTFYTDVTDAYRLGRWARLRTDLGGIYFHLIFALGIIALYLVSGQEVLLAVVMVISVDILYQCLPYVRLDGYWALADLTGIPDFFSQMGPFLRSLFPIPQLKRSRLPSLLPWVKAVFAIYITLTIPTLAFFSFLIIKNFPRFMAVGGDSLFYQTRIFAIAWSTEDFVRMAAAASQILLLTLSMAAAVYLIASTSRMLSRGLWSWSRSSHTRRIAGALVAVGAVTLLVFLWAPELPFAGKPVPAGVQRFEVAERAHVQTPVSYPQTPPVGGDHAPIWQNCGFYEAPIANEHAVHSLEHGAVWITYRPDLPGAQIDMLRRLARRQPYLLVSAFPDLPTPVIASAWGRQLRLDSPDDPRLGQFVRAFRLGSQAPERGGPCTGGVGIPSRD